ncbi:MAG: methylisocitrate lyase [Nitrososphaerota archaeon]|jgi:methylisocitrate lyase|nr:methylisocitrate lyase [Nitrososphaerota archaeon]
MNIALAVTTDYILAANNYPSTALRKLLNGKRIITAPGVFSPAVAILAQKEGFKCAYFSGAGFANQLGLPDLGVTTLSEVSRGVEEITSVADIPLLVDIDTGFGESTNVARTVTIMERLGAAAIQIEDQVMPKRCGHLSGKEVVSKEEMVRKIIVAKRARKTDMILIARTDAASVEGIESAIERAKLYLKAGADVIFPEALESKRDFLKFAKQIRAPLLANMTEFGKSPYITTSEFEEMGYKIVIFPVTAFRAAMMAVRETLHELSKKGTQKKLLKKMITRDEFNKIIDYESYARLDSETLLESKRLNTN